MDYLDVTIIALGTLLISSFNAAFGPTGGVQLALVAGLLPPNLAIPVHGVISGLASLSRLWRLKSHVNWALCRRFCIGSIIGTALAFSVFVQIQSGVLLMLIGTFILLNNHLNYQRFISNHKRSYADFGVGLASGALTVFVGATGPLVFSYIAAADNNRFSVLASDAACMTFQHLTKIIAFSLLTFSLSVYWLELTIFAVCAVIGTQFGVLLVNKISEQTFRLVCTAITSLVGIYLLLSGLITLLSTNPA